MKLVDLTHTFSIHTPGWVGYPSPKLSYFQRHATHGIVSQWLELPLHSGTHFDGEMHIVSGGADMASIPLERLCRQGVIVDISDELDDWSVITPEMITSRAEVRKGDILLYHTGWNRYFNGGADEENAQKHELSHRRMLTPGAQNIARPFGYEFAVMSCELNCSYFVKHPFFPAFVHFHPPCRCS